MATKISKEIFDSAHFGANSSKPGIIAPELVQFGAKLTATDAPTLVGKLTGEIFVSQTPVWDENGNKTDEVQTLIHVEVQHGNTVNRIKANNSIKTEFVENDGEITLPAKKVRFRIIADTYREKTFVAGQILQVLTAADKSGDFIPANWGKNVPEMVAESTPKTVEQVAA